MGENARESGSGRRTGEDVRRDGEQLGDGGIEAEPGGKTRLRSGARVYFSNASQHTHPLMMDLHVDQADQPISKAKRSVRDTYGKNNEMPYTSREEKESRNVRTRNGK